MGKFKDNLRASSAILRVHTGHKLDQEHNILVKVIKYMLSIKTKYPILDLGDIFMISDHKFSI